MNAYEELFCEVKSCNKNTSPVVPEGYEILHTGEKYGRTTYVVGPKEDTLLKEIEEISWAGITYDPGCLYGDDSIINAKLPSNRTDDDVRRFIDTLKSITYDNGFGSQELYGIVVYKNGNWLERAEYDGSEWWSLKEVPQEPKW